MYVKIPNLFMCCGFRACIQKDAIRAPGCMNPGAQISQPTSDVASEVNLFILSAGLYRLSFQQPWAAGSSYNCCGVRYQASYM